MPFLWILDQKWMVKEQLEFELTHYNVTVQHVSHHAMVTPPPGHELPKIDLRKENPHSLNLAIFSSFSTESIS